MKKILIAVAALIAFFVLKDMFVDTSGFPITGYQSQVSDIKGNVLTLQSGLRVQLLGVNDGRTDVETFVKNNYQGKSVSLISDSKSQIQNFSSIEEIVQAYVILDDSRQCLNHLIVNEYPESYTQLATIDSIGWVDPGKDPASKQDLALYMKQRTFLIQTSEGLGTGFFINANGLAITNCHVMAPGQERSSQAILYQNSADDSQMYSDKKRNIDTILWSQDINGLDISVFTVNLQNGETVPFFNLAQKHAKIGGKCATFGNPSGFTASYSTGDISAYRKDDRGVDLIQYTMATNGGNSGGPVCDEAGQVIAVHELGRKDLQNVNFGIDILQVRQVLDQMGVKYGGQ